MKLNDTTLIERLAYDLRAVLESLAPSLPIGLAEFPRGACGDTSLLLGTLLVDHGVAGFEYICGDRGSHDDGTWTSHAWLHRDGLVIDITADQFDDGPGPVIVSSDSAWHRGFDWVTFAFGLSQLARARNIRPVPRVRGGQDCSDAESSQQSVTASRRLRRAPLTIASGT